MRGPVLLGILQEVDELVDVSRVGEEGEEGRDRGLQQGLAGDRITRAVLARGRVPELLDRGRVHVDGGLELVEVRAERSERAVGGGEERVEPDVLDQHRPGARHAPEVEVVAPGVHREREHAQAVVVGRALGRGQVAGVVAERAQQARQVQALGGAQVPRHPPRPHRLHPRRGGVEAALPRVDEGDERGAVESPFPEQPRVVGDELRHHLVDERASRRGRERVGDARRPRARRPAAA